MHQQGFPQNLWISHYGQSGDIMVSKRYLRELSERVIQGLEWERRNREAALSVELLARILGEACNDCSLTLFRQRERK